MHLNEREKEELIRLSRSSSLRKDMRQIAVKRRDRFQNRFGFDLDTWLKFLNEYNEFINHNPKPFRPIKEKVMKL